MKVQGELTIKLYGDGFSFWVGGPGRQMTYDQEPHFKLFDNICRYFKRRGFNVGKDPRISKEYSRSFSKDYKYGRKGDLEFKANRYSAGFKFQFYQNINVDNRYGGEHDFYKYKMMPYMIKLSYRNEMLRLANYLAKVGVDCIIEKPLTEVEAIIQTEKNNTHIHGEGIETLEDINRVVNEKNMGHNAQDTNGKLIISGEYKFFYDSSTKRLSKGRVIHSSNNMWRVLVNDVRHTKANFELFDFSPELPRRKKFSKEVQLNKLREILIKNENEMNYERCITLRNVIRYLEGDSKKYRVWSNKWGKWWGPNNAGYTSDERKAGIYLEDNVMGHLDYYNDGEVNKIVEIK